MQSFSFPRRDSGRIFATQQRFSFGESVEEVLAPRRYRTGWISDAHLGTRGCNATALLDFLRANDFETLYVVGDLIDIWSLRRGIYWPQLHNDVIQKILRKARKGTHVIYIPGNHDELVTDFCGAYGNVEIKQRAIHVTASGERILIMHGHELDAVVQTVKWLAFAGDVGYQFLLSLNPLINFVRRRFGLGYWSLSAYAKRRVKDAVSFIGKFEAAVAHYAQPSVSLATSRTITAVTGSRAARHSWRATMESLRWSITIRALRFAQLGIVPSSFPTGMTKSE
jgi:UDP-2,3-diacylglucosamine pyrophosphatase LpxH